MGGITSNEFLRKMDGKQVAFEAAKRRRLERFARGVPAASAHRPSTPSASCAEDRSAACSGLRPSATTFTAPPTAAPAPAEEAKLAFLLKRKDRNVLTPAQESALAELLERRNKRLKM
eukprot:COSAG05_NODE_8356_length_711_cov_1.341503_1_plen_118_part_00